MSEWKCSERDCDNTDPHKHTNFVSSEVEEQKEEIKMYSPNETTPLRWGNPIREADERLAAKKESVEMQNRTLDAPTGVEKDKTVGEAPERIWIDAEQDSRRWHYNQPRGVDDSSIEYVRSDIASTSDWQDIESAPKDGSHILFGRELPWSSSANVCIGFWADEHQTDFPEWHSTEGVLVDTRVYRYWMPLPQPPSVSKPATATASARLSNDTNESPASTSESCPDCDGAARRSYSDATTPGFFYTKCSKHGPSSDQKVGE